MTFEYLAFSMLAYWGFLFVLCLFVVYDVVSTSVNLEDNFLTYFIITGFSVAPVALISKLFLETKTEMFLFMSLAVILIFVNLLLTLKRQTKNLKGTESWRDLTGNHRFDCVLVSFTGLIGGIYVLFHTIIDSEIFKKISIKKLLDKFI